MKTFILTISLLILLTLAAVAQSMNPEVYPQQISIEHNEAVKSFSSDYLINNIGVVSSLLGFPTTPRGNRTNGIIDVEGAENITYLSQQGYGITGMMDIDGHGNQTNMQQRGSNLLSILSIEGNANQFDMTQEGSGLQSFFKVSGSGTTYEAHQTNAGMNFRQSGTGSVPLSIQQKGRPSPVIIRNY